MARRATPWLRKGRGWYVQVDGKQVSLGKDKAGAFRRYYALMQQPQQEQVGSHTVLAVCDDFLDWTKRNRSEATFDWYLRYLQSFVQFLSDNGNKRLVGSQLRPRQVLNWLATETGWNCTSQRNAIVAVQRCLNWAERMGYVDRSPIRNLEKPQAKVRDQIISQEEFDAILAEVSDVPFRDLLTTSWETGCRPQELTRVEARHVDLENSRWIFPPSEAKGKRKPRIVYLTQPA